MTEQDPKARPSSSDAFEAFKEIRAKLSFWSLHYPLHWRDDSLFRRCIKDASCLASDASNFALNAITLPARTGLKLYKTFLHNRG